MCTTQSDDFNLTETGFNASMSLKLSNEDSAAQSKYLTDLRAGMCDVYARAALSINDGGSWTVDEIKKVLLIEKGKDRSACVASGSHLVSALATSAFVLLALVPF